jgi:uncharacterized membrane protein (UPF0127 family)
MIRAPRPVRRALIVLFAALTAGCGGSSGALEGHERGTLRIVGDEGEVALDVAIAEDPAERSAGLMGILELGESEGMVFLPGDVGEGSFTMRGTLIPLSLGVWGPDGRLRAILDMVPCEEEPCPSYDPGVEWLGAVEVNRGFFERNGIGVGDRVRLER